MYGRDCAYPSPAELRAQIAPLDLQSLSPPEPSAEALWALGAALYFDPILSGNRDMSCATCHRPERGLGDGRSLAVGTNAVLTEDRRLPSPDHSFTPRNAPPLFNLGRPTLHTMFWDRRLEVVDAGGFILHDTSYEATGVVRLSLPDTLEGLMAVQAALPLLIRDEMREGRRRSRYRWAAQ